MPARKPTPEPWWFEPGLGVVYGGVEGDVVVVGDNIQISDGDLVAAAPALLRTLLGMRCHSCTYQVGDPAGGCSSCEDARAAVASAGGEVAMAVGGGA